MARNPFQLEAAARLRARDVTLVGIQQVLETRATLAITGPGDAGAGGNINQPEFDADGEQIVGFDGWSPDDHKLDVVNLG